MPFDASIIATTPVSVLPMLPELQNLVFEFMHGSTTLYAQKRIAPICEEVLSTVRPYQSVMDKTRSLSEMLTQYQTQGFVQSFMIQESGIRFTNYFETYFTIDWTNRTSGPINVTVCPHWNNGSIYVTDLMLPAAEEADDEYDENSYEFGLTLECFSSGFRIQEFM